ncbi:hypothetical protein [Massilia oculi]|uniref:hypothetical protein n=1 Tax=Massilia oculi TaxID=945844 RepID=UPI0028A6DCE5|nr:hypothetical protein [Massilia oculi]
MTKQKTFTGLANAPASERLEAFFGITPEIQQQIGTFVIVWAMFESDIELLIWMATGEEPAGRRPSTDAKQISELINKLRKWARESATWPLRPTLVAICEAADNLAAYRNAIIHGRPLEGPKFVSNGSFFGELRKRPVATAHISPDLMGMAIDSAEILHRATGLLGAVYAGQLDEGTPIVQEALGNVLTATRQSTELRYLADKILDGTYP